MNSKFRIILFGDKCQRDITCSFLPEVSLSSIDFFDDLTAEAYEFINKNYYTHNVLLLRAGLAVNIGFWEYMFLKKIVPGQILLFPVREATDVQIDGVFEAYKPSPLDIMPVLPPEGLPLDIAFSHGVTLYEVSKKISSSFWRSAQECGLDVAIDKGAAAYRIDNTIWKKTEELNSVDRRVEDVVGDIKNILRGERELILSKADRLVNQVMSNRAEEVFDKIGQTDDNAPDTVAQEALMKIVNNHFRNSQMRETVRQARGEKISEDAPSDIQYRKYKKRSDQF